MSSNWRDDTPRVVCISDHDLLHNAHLSCFILRSSHPVWVHAFSQSFASNSVLGIHAAFSSNFLYQTFHDGHPLLLLHLLLHCRLLLLALQSLQLVFSKKRKNSCPTIFSQLFNSDFLLLRTLLHSNGLFLPLKVPFLVFFDFVLSPGPLLSILSAKFFQHGSI